ncbi:MAG: universal stress protein [Bacteroidetes bacterium]|nr:universal stress protein [Bacteroidota bacterium]
MNENHPQTTVNEQKEQFVVIRNLSYSRALLLKMRLEMEGVQSYITHIYQPEVGVDLNIPEADAQLAYELLDELREATGIQKEAIVRKMRGLRRILVPVDFSELSVKAAHYALDLARTLKAEVMLLNAWFNAANQGFVFNEMYAYQLNVEELLREQEQQAQAQIEDLATELRKRIRDEKMRGVKVDYDLVRGGPIESILDYIAEYQPGTVVMGTHGTRREGLALLGSTTARLIEKCPVPVLAVPWGYDTSNFSAPRNVAYLTRFDENDLQAIHRLVAFARPFKVKIYCVHLHPDDSLALDSLRMKKLRDYFAEAITDVEIECGLIESADALEGLKQFVMEKQIDVLALISRKRNLIEQLLRPSLTRKLLFSADVPLLVFRETENASWIASKG